MDTRMIDVAIGLVLVFAMTSLLVTALQEALAQTNGDRGLILRQAIESFVGDDPAFAKALMAHPLLLSLSRERISDGDKGRPSYIGADSIVAALIGHLVQTHAGGVRPQTPGELVDVIRHVASGRLSLAAAGAAPPDGAAMAGAPAALPNTLFARGLSTLAIGVERDWPAFEARIAAWYESIGARSTGWFKRRAQKSIFALGLATAVVANINPIVIGARLWDDEPLRKAIVSSAERALEANSTASATDVRPAPAAASAPAAPAPGLSASAAVRRASLAGAVDEFATALVTAVRPLPATHPLAASFDTLAGRLRALSDAARQSEGAAADAEPGAARRMQALADALLEGLPAGAVSPALRASHDRLRDALSARPAPTAPTSAALPPECDGLADPSVLNLCRRVAELQKLRQTGLPIGWSRNTRPSVWDEQCAQPAAGPGDSCPWGKALGDGHWWLNSLLMPVGWLVTALAATLGAPFWFDALGRLVRLRASGVRPKDVPGPDATTGTAPPSQLARSQPAVGAGAGVGVEAPAVGEPMSDALTDAERRLTSAEVQRLQRTLGMAEVELSGFFDGATRQRIVEWQQRHGILPASGELSDLQLHDLLSVPPGGRDDDYLG